MEYPNSSHAKTYQEVWLSVATANAFCIHNSNDSFVENPWFFFSKRERWQTLWRDNQHHYFRTNWVCEDLGILKNCQKLQAIHLHAPHSPPPMYLLSCLEGFVQKEAIQKGDETLLFCSNSSWGWLRRFTSKASCIPVKWALWCSLQVVLFTSPVAKHGERMQGTWTSKWQGRGFMNDWQALWGKGYKVIGSTCPTVSGSLCQAFSCRFPLPQSDSLVDGIIIVMHSHWAIWHPRGLINIPR